MVSGSEKWTNLSCIKYEKWLCTKIAINPWTYKRYGGCEVGGDTHSLIVFTGTISGTISHFYGFSIFYIPFGKIDRHRCKEESKIVKLPILRAISWITWRRRIQLPKVAKSNFKTVILAVTVDIPQLVPIKTLKPWKVLLGKLRGTVG